MARCISPKLGGSLPCDANLAPLESDPTVFICTHCRRRYGVDEMWFVESANAYDDMLRAKKAQEKADSKASQKQHSGKVFS